MKMAIKLTFKVTTGILLTALMASAAWAQTSGAPQAAKPLPGAPAPAVKPAVIPTSKPAAKPAAQNTDADSDSGSTSELKSVKVTHSSGDIQIEMNASGPVTPKVSKLDSPARVLVELPETSVATPQKGRPRSSKALDRPGRSQLLRLPLRDRIGADRRRRV